MFRQLLVPLDGSGFGEDTLPVAAAVARSTGADVAVAHVHVPHVPDHLISNTQYVYEGLDLDEYDARDRENEFGYLKGVADRLGAELGRPVQPLLLTGEVPEAIDEYVDTTDASGMIVMATHGRTGFSRAWLGSVADAVVRHAPWPVLLIRPPVVRATPEVRFDRILVPLDGSTRSERILPHVVELAEATGATVLLVRVVPSAAVTGTRVLPISEAALAEAGRRARHELEDVRDRLARRAIPADVRVIDHEKPARAILKLVEQEEPDLVAMATHGYRGVARAMLGSCADKVVRGCHVPVLLLGPSAEA